MFIEEIKYIADIEMMRLGSLTKGIRWEIVNAAKKGKTFTQVVSLEDAERISAELCRAGLRYKMTYKKVGENRREITFNA